MTTQAQRERVLERVRIAMPITFAFESRILLMRLYQKAGEFYDKAIATLEPAPSDADATVLLAAFMSGAVTGVLSHVELENQEER